MKLNSLALLALVITACGKPHDVTLAVTCVSADGLTKYELTQYTDRKDSGQCSKNGHTTYFQFLYDGDSERYQDMCTIEGLTIKYVNNVAKITDTNESMVCTNK
jgi:hypothetical protein